MRVVREVEAIGGNVTSSASRDQMAYTYNALKIYAPHMVELLVDSVINPVFLDLEIEEQLHKVKEEIQELKKKSSEVNFGRASFCWIHWCTGKSSFGS